MPKPWDADAFPDLETAAIGPFFFDCGDDLMSGDKREGGMRQFIIVEVEIGAADPAGVHFEQQLPLLRDGDGEVEQLQGSMRLCQDHCFHNNTIIKHQLTFK